MGVSLWGPKGSDMTKRARAWVCAYKAALEDSSVNQL